MNKLPQARNIDLVQQESGQELLIYDMKIQKAYCLNETASIVWQKCDGMTTFDELIRQTDLTEDLILLTLEALQKDNLLMDEIETGIPKDKLSRRKVIMTAGAAALALPLIVSLTTPTLAQVNSCVAPFGTVVGTSTAAQPANQACNNATNQCCSASSSQQMDSVDVNGNHTCNAVCGTIIA